MTRLFSCASRPSARLIALMVYMLCLLLACEDKTAPSPRLARTSSTARIAPLVLSPIKASRADVQGALKADWLPSESQLKKRIEDTIATSSALATKGEAPISLELQIAALRVAPPQEPEKLALGASITLSEAPPGWQDARLERFVILDPAPSEDAEKQEKLDATVKELLAALVARHELAMIPDARLLNALEGLTVVSVEQAHDALARLRHVQREEPYGEADRARVVNVLRQLATREDPRLLTGVFAALREFGASGYGALLVEAATGTSQRGEFPAFVALLAQMGEVKEPAVHAYLQSVSSGHPDESIRQIASESLARH